MRDGKCKDVGLSSTTGLEKGDVGEFDMLENDFCLVGVGATPISTGAKAYETCGLRRDCRSAAMDIASTV